MLQGKKHDQTSFRTYKLDWKVTIFWHKSLANLLNGLELIHNFAEMSSNTGGRSNAKKEYIKYY